MPELMQREGVIDAAKLAEFWRHFKAGLFLREHHVLPSREGSASRRQRCLAEPALPGTTYCPFKTCFASREFLLKRCMSFQGSEEEDDRRAGLFN